MSTRIPLADVIAVWDELEQKSRRIDVGSDLHQGVKVGLDEARDLLLGVIEKYDR